jgi:hypothetical protein
MKNQIVMFIELCHQLERKCIRHKHRFLDGKFNNIKHSDNEFTIYYAGNYEDWSVTCHGFSYSNYSNEISFPAIPNFESELIRANNRLIHTIGSFQDVTNLKRRKLN